MSTRGTLMGFALSLGLLTEPAGAQVPVARMAEAAQLVEELLKRAEAASGRPFDPAFRATAVRVLAALPAEELEARRVRDGIGPLTLGDTTAQLVYTRVTPCRIIDTRVAGGSLPVEAPRDFRVTGVDFSIQGGEVLGCQVPFGRATAALINFVAVQSTGQGNLRAWAYRTPPPEPPTASILNFAFIAGSGLNIANGIAIPICDSTQTGQTCPYDFRVQADGNSTHVVADVLGYFERFPKEQVRSFSVMSGVGATTTLSATCTHVTGAQVSLTAPVAGKVIVRGIVPLTIQHASGVADVLFAGIGASATDCSFPSNAVAQFSVPSAAASAPYDTTLPVMATFNVAANAEPTFYLNASLSLGAGNGDFVAGQRARLEATFIPN